MYTSTRRLSALVMMGLLSSCKVGPDYHAPATTPPQEWHASAFSAQGRVEQDWWKHFHDATLDQLIAKALAGNWDLKIAEARIAQARAARASAGNELLPTVNTTANAERQANRIAFPGNGLDLSKPFNTFQTGFDASWEFDLFGGKRRGLEAANADLQSAQASRDEARVSLLAEVARAYVDIRQYQGQLAIVKDTITAQETTSRIASERFKAGQTAGIDVTQAQAQVMQAKAQLPFYTNQLLQTELSVDLLLGEQPGYTQTLITSLAAVPVADKALVLAAPAKVIASRPDIRAAERNLASATAQQGVAVAQFFPDISLTGFFGLLNTDAGNLLRTSSKSWDVGGGILWPILNYGKLSANLDAANARQQEALATYRKTILTALSDVERSITAYTQEEAHRAALDETAQGNAHSVKIARERYKEGLSSFLEVLDAQRTLFASQSQALQASAAASQNLIAVYKSLGGGWQDATPALKK